ncbi:facilitated trehalose transporter Tret1-like [Athalia rosae]|uniref:facilitated trehalose transporter Tret1-like n=1 Tax=Athalia rosae TaxID=37344 RepID=UPI00203373D5|nr:facilitated trehalose transporter Tret1-like [Athalia rosae]
MGKPKFRTQIIVGIAATFSFTSPGFHLGWPSPSLPSLQAADSDIPITSSEGSWIVSFLTFGCLFGAPIAALLVDSLGRKLSLLLGAFPLIVAGILLHVADSFWWLIAARFMAGIGTGMMFTVAPIYLAEIASADIRGALTSMISLSINVGILLTYCVGPWVSRVTLASLGTVVPIIFVLMFVWAPESPYYLIMKNDRKSAIKSLQWLREDGDVNADVGKIEESIEFDQKHAGTFRDLVLVPGNRKALYIIVGITIAQQFSGVIAILSYCGLIFETAGSTLDPSISVIIVGAVQFISGIVCIFTVDLTGRRPLLLISTVGSSIFLGGVALYFQLKAGGTDVSSISWLPLSSLVGYNIAYTIGLGIIQCVILSEIFPYNVKALAGMTCAMTGSFGGMAVAKFYQVVADGWGIHAAFWSFSGFTICSAVFTLIAVPETKQRSLQEIQEQLHKTTESKIALEKSGE